MRNKWDAIFPHITYDLWAFRYHNCTRNYIQYKSMLPNNDNYGSLLTNTIKSLPFVSSIPQAQGVPPLLTPHLQHFYPLPRQFLIF